jgi:hypothetical protein
MVQVRLHAPVKDMRGKTGFYTYRVMRGKQTLMKTPDMSRVKWSEAQKASREHFRKAISYAKQAMADAQVHAYYEKIAEKANRQAFRVAVSDFLAGKNLLEKK